MATLNKAIIIGHLGRDPEVINKSLPVVKVSMCTQEKTKDKETGTYNKVVDWHNVTLFQKSAELVKDYAHKGDLIYVEGKIKNSKYKDKNGIERTKTEIMATDVKLIKTSANEQKQTTNDYYEDIPY